jgi:hypothetical protein
LNNTFPIGLPQLAIGLHPRDLSLFANGR